MVFVYRIDTIFLFQSILLVFFGQFESAANRSVCRVRQIWNECIALFSSFSSIAHSFSLSRSASPFLVCMCTFETIKSYSRADWTPTHKNDDRKISNQFIYVVKVFVIVCSDFFQFQTFSANSIWAKKREKKRRKKERKNRTAVGTIVFREIKHLLLQMREILCAQLIPVNGTRLQLLIHFN